MRPIRLLLLLIILLPLPATAGQTAHFIPPDITLVAADDTGLILELVLPSWRLEPAEGPDGPCHRVLIDNWARTDRPGLPELPRLGCAVALPPGTAVEVTVVHAEYESRDVERIYPTPLPGPDERHPLTIQRPDKIWPGSLVTAGASTVARGQRLARVLFHPFQWDPGTGRLQIATRLAVRVDFVEAPLSYGTDGFGSSGGHGSLGGRSVRLEVQEDGLYVFDYLEALMLTGMSEQQAQNIDPATLKLSTGGEQVPLLRDGSTVYFHGLAWDDQYTGTNVYWLRWGGQPGARMGQLDGSLLPQGTAVDRFDEKIRYEQNTRMWENAPGVPDADYWFWEQLSAPTTMDTVLEVPDPAAGPWTGTVRSCSQGRSTASTHPNHHTRILVNGTDVGGHYWDDDMVFIQESSVSDTLLTDGSNTVSLHCPGDTGASVDIVYLNWIEVEYPRALQAVDGQLVFGTAGGGEFNFTVGGFDDPAVSVFEIGDPQDIRQVDGVSVTANGGLFDLSFGREPAGAERYLALTPGALRAPAAMEAWTSPRLRDGGAGADYILISPRAFRRTVGHLKKYREEEGFRAKAVAVEDIYNEFSHGRIDPAAIRDFLAHAYAEWTPPAPLYVLLLGDANTDYRDYFGTGKQSLVPVHLTVTELGLTPDDNWFVAVEGNDVLPEMAIGRLPASDGAAAKRVVDRLLIHERSAMPAPTRALFVADDEVIFENLNETLAAMLPPAFRADRVYLREYPDTETATADIKRAFGRGEMIVNYNGHGSVTSWAGETLFDTADVADLVNDDELAFVLTLTCLNGYFSHPFYYSMAEELGALSPGGGFGCFSPSGLSYTWEQNLLAPQIFENIFDHGEDRIGLIVTEAKLAAHALGGSNAMVSMFTLIGDPASRLHPWE